MSRLPILYVVVALVAALVAWISPAGAPPAVPSVDRRADATPIPPAEPVVPGEARARGEEGPAKGRVRHVRVVKGPQAPHAPGPVELGLKWLAAAQAEDGSWSGGRDTRPDPAVTGLVLLSCLGNGETHKMGRNKKSVKRGFKYLKTIQGPHGNFGTGSRPEDAVGHAIATLAMCEAYGLTRSPLFKASAQAGLDWIGRFRRPYTSVAFWELMALRSGSVAGLEVPKSTARNAREWLDLVTDARNGLAYCPSAGVLPRTVVGQTAAAVFCRILHGEDLKKSEMVQAGVDIVLARRPGTPGSQHDPGALYFGTLVMFQCGGKAWRTWNKALKAHGMKGQVRTGKLAGTYPPVGPTGTWLGRAGTTALHLMIQQIYYRYSRVYGLRS